MNFLKRGYLAVTRRKSRSLILLLILVIMSTSILASLSIVNATQNASLVARETLGSNATLTFDYKQTVDSAINNQGTTPQIKNISDYEESALAIASHHNVEDYNFIMNTYAMAGDFTPIGLEQENNVDVDFDIMSPEIIVVGVSSSELLTALDGDSIRIVEGRHVSSSTGNEAIIEKKLAEANNLTVGSTIAINQFNGDSSYDLEVVGIYENHENNLLNLNNVAAYSPLVEPANRIYVNYEVGKAIRPAQIDTALGNVRLPSAGVDRVVYFIDEPENVDTFIAETKSMPLEWEELRIDANDRAYNIMVEPVNRVASFAKKVIYATAIVGAIIISLILMLWIKERNYETGVLLSIGEEKRKIVAQYVCEVLVIAVFAFAISIVAGSMISQSAANSLMDRQLNHMDHDSQEVTVRDLVNEGVANSSRIRRVAGISGVPGEPIDTIEVRVSFKEVWRMMALALIIIACSVMIPVTYVMRFNPKTILTQVN